LRVAVRSVVVHSYNEAPAPIFLYILPLMIVGAMRAFFIREKPFTVTDYMTMC
jgi:hypothetical protein